MNYTTQTLTHQNGIPSTVKIVGENGWSRNMFSFQCKNGWGRNTMFEDFGNKYQVSKKLYRCPICRRYVDTKKESVYNLYWSWENKPSKLVCRKCLGKYGKSWLNFIWAQSAPR